MNNLADFSRLKLEKILKEEFSQPSYRAGQLYKSVTRFNSYDEMSDLPLSLRDKLKEKYSDRFHDAKLRQHSLRIDAGGMQNGLRFLRVGNRRTCA